MACALCKQPAPARLTLQCVDRHNFELCPACFAGVFVDRRVDWKNQVHDPSFVCPCFYGPRCKSRCGRKVLFNFCTLEPVGDRTTSCPICRAGIRTDALAKHLENDCSFFLSCGVRVYSLADALSHLPQTAVVKPYDNLALRMQLSLNAAHH